MKFSVRAIARYSRLARLALPVMLIGVVSGCAKSPPKTVAEAPPLAIPQPPPRVLAPVDEPLAASPATPETTTSEPPRTPTRMPARRPPAMPADGEPKPTDVPAVPVTPAPVVESTRPAPTPADAAEERKVRDVLTRATRDLSKVDYRRLSMDGRAQYEQSKRFTDQAEQALKDRNFVFATTLADKAAALAAELSSR